MYCPNCKSANVLYNEDFDEYYCLVCNYYFALESPTDAETPPESPEQDASRVELLIL